MNTIDLSPRLRLVAGLRLENTSLNTLSYGSLIDPTSPNLAACGATGDFSGRLAAKPDGVVWTQMRMNKAGAGLNRTVGPK